MKTLERMAAITRALVRARRPLTVRELQAAANTTCWPYNMTPILRVLVSEGLVKRNEKAGPRIIARGRAPDTFEWVQ